MKYLLEVQMSFLRLIPIKHISKDTLLRRFFPATKVLINNKVYIKILEQTLVASSACLTAWRKIF